jgi:hypothetical protein
VLQEQLDNLLRRRRVGDLGDSAYAALYFLHWQIAAHGRRFASRKFKDDPRPNSIAWLSDLEPAGGDELHARLIKYMGRYNFLGVIPNVSAALGAWLQGRWALSLYQRIPCPQEMLRMQVQGSRAVTVLAEYPRLLQPVLSKPNAFAFMIHDLEHAYKFFHDPDLHQGQRRFFSQVLGVIERGLLDDCMRDPMFVAKFDYLISDMNTHALHSLQYLRAILIEYHLRNAGKQAGERLPSQAQGEVDAVMRLFDGHRHLVFDKQLPGDAVPAQLGIRYAEGPA